MSIPFPLETLGSWLHRDTFLQKNELSLPEDFGRLLTSLDSMTLRLERLYAGKVQINMEKQVVVPAPTNGARFWPASYEFPHSQESLLSRDAWLLVQDKREIFAHTELSLNGLDEHLRRGIEKGDLPLGTLILNDNTTLERANLELVQLKAPTLAGWLGASSEKLFWARRTLLLIEGRVQGRILEIFLNWS